MIARFIVAILVFSMCSCSVPDFSDETVRNTLAQTPVSLQGEQVTLTDQQVGCGVQAELWDPPSGLTAKLTQKGRDLKFSDDVRVSDPEIHQPFTQVTGSLPVQVTDVLKIKDGEGEKLAEVKVGVVIAHECFKGSLPIMGVHKGKFSPSAPVVFRFTGGGKEWALDKLLH